MATAIRTAASNHMARSTALVSLALAAAVVFGGGLAWACSINANIPEGGLTPNHGPPGTDVQVEGREFNPGQVEIRWDSTTGPLLGTAMVGPQDEGSFETTVTIPEQASQQVHTIVAVQQPYKAQATFEVTSPETGPSGQESDPPQNDGNEGGGSGTKDEGRNELSGDADGEQSNSQGDSGENSQSAAAGEGENALSGGRADTSSDGSGDEGSDSRPAEEPRNALTQGNQAGSPAGSSPGSPREEVSAKDTKPPRAPQETPTVNGQPDAAQESPSIVPTSDADNDATSPRGETPAGDMTSGTQAADAAAGDQPAASTSSNPSDAVDDEPQEPSTESENNETGLRPGSQEEREPSPNPQAAGRDLWSGFAGDEAPSLTAPAAGDGATSDGMSEELLLALAMVSVGALGLFGAGAFALRRRTAQLRHRYAASRPIR